MEIGDSHIERRVERVQFETDRQIIVGNVTLPPEGYQSRFSDSLNRVDVAFIPVVDVEISSIDGGDSVRREFAVVNKEHVRVAFPIEEVRPAGPAAPTGGAL
jgi:hypothetical protein